MIPDNITVVSGIPRSGTSMMMQILEAGGMEIFTDKMRKADEDNPRGYYEAESVKRLKEDDSFLKEVRGKGIKIISKLLKKLPNKFQYKLIFVHRNMDEILCSQQQMLIRRGEVTDSISDKKLATIFQQHLKEIQGWIASNPSMDVLYVNYSDILEDSINQVESIEQFLGRTLDIHKMAGCVDKTLYRQRR
ncbi:sulfotransferase domain-containing protein [Desulfobacula sp.]|uniref:sulfotransferase domain-containing protein n=1 Tax=Desulfobacula sp. TaxID=2593537 RepID=UPI002609E0FA|nr:sulfotransferase domain-containing protein [Desulfobacula sp.]